VTLTPAEWALIELAALTEPPLATEDDVARFHERLSDIVRRYLELRFGLRAPEQTTAEFLQEMRGCTHLLPDQQSALRDFLERCDLVKFARVIPCPEECGALAELARRVVVETASATTPVS
jgi:hypothetical protein